MVRKMRIVRKVVRIGGSWSGKGGEEDEGLMNGNEQNIIDMWSCNQPMSSITKLIICCLL